MIPPPSLSPASAEVFRYDPTGRRIVVGFAVFLWGLVVAAVILVPNDLPARWTFAACGVVFSLLAAGVLRCRITIDGDALTRRGVVGTRRIPRDEIGRVDITDEGRLSSRTGIAIYRIGRSLPSLTIDQRWWDRTGDLTRALRALDPPHPDDPPRREPPAWARVFGSVRREMDRQEREHPGSG